MTLEVSEVYTVSTPTSSIIRDQSASSSTAASIWPVKEVQDENNDVVSFNNKKKLAADQKVVRDIIAGNYKKSIFGNELSTLDALKQVDDAVITNAFSDINFSCEMFNNYMGRGSRDDAVIGYIAAAATNTNKSIGLNYNKDIDKHISNRKTNELGYMDCWRISRIVRFNPPVQLTQLANAQ